MRCRQVDVTLRLRAAQALLKFGGDDAPSAAPAGKKAQKQLDARQAATGRFAPQQTPKIVPIRPKPGGDA
jgi:hypothetical protein